MNTTNIISVEISINKNQTTTIDVRKDEQELGGYSLRNDCPGGYSIVPPTPKFCRVGEARSITIPIENDEWTRFLDFAKSQGCDVISMPDSFKVSQILAVTNDEYHLGIFWEHDPVDQTDFSWAPRNQLKHFIKREAFDDVIKTLIA